MLRRRISWEEMAYTRNPYPARGPGILSLDMLRYYVRKFFTDPLYSLANVRGSKSAFIRACGMESGYFRALIVRDPPLSQFLSSSAQKRISKQVQLILSGKIHYENDMTQPNRALAVYDPKGEPPQGMKPDATATHWKLSWGKIGPRFDRIPPGSP